MTLIRDFQKFWQYLRLQIHQITEFQTPFTLQSGNLSFILYAVIQATLFTNLYTAVILSSLVQGQNPKPWNSFREMVALIKERGESQDCHPWNQALKNAF